MKKSWAIFGAGLLRSQKKNNLKSAGSFLYKNIFRYCCFVWNLRLSPSDPLALHSHKVQPGAPVLLGQPPRSWLRGPIVQGKAPALTDVT